MVAHLCATGLILVSSSSAVLLGFGNDSSLGGCSGLAHVLDKLPGLRLLDCRGLVVTLCLHLLLLMCTLPIEAAISRIFCCFCNGRYHLCTQGRHKRIVARAFLTGVGSKSLSSWSAGGPVTRHQQAHLHPPRPQAKPPARRKPAQDSVCPNSPCPDSQVLMVRPPVQQHLLLDRISEEYQPLNPLVPKALQVHLPGGEICACCATSKMPNARSS